jgi:hypothetical protein
MQKEAAAVGNITVLDLDLVGLTSPRVRVSSSFHQAEAVPASASKLKPRTLIIAIIRRVRHDACRRRRRTRARALMQHVWLLRLDLGSRSDKRV